LVNPSSFFSHTSNCSYRRRSHHPSSPTLRQGGYAQSRMWSWSCEFLYPLAFYDLSIQSARDWPLSLSRVDSTLPPLPSFPRRASTKLPFHISPPTKSIMPTLRKVSLNPRPLTPFVLVSLSSLLSLAHVSPLVAELSLRLFLPSLGHSSSHLSPSHDFSRTLTSPRRMDVGRRLRREQDSRKVAGWVEARNTGNGKHWEGEFSVTPFRFLF